MLCLLEGTLIVIGAVFAVLLACVYLIDWDRVIRESTELVEEEWRREPSSTGRIPYDQDGGCP